MQEPLYSFLSAPFVHASVGEADSPVRLQAHIRACMALSRLSSCVPVLWAEGSESPLSRADRLWEFAMGKCGVSAFSLADRFRLCDALYVLCRETALVPVSGREDLCEGLLSSLLEDRALTGQPVAGDEDTVCACCRALQSALFPWVEEDDSWFRSLCATLSGWCAEQATDGSWSGISAVQAWHRLSVLNRHSWLFRDHSFDAAVSAGCRYYGTAFCHAPATPDTACAFLEALSGGHLLSCGAEGEERALGMLLAVLRDADAEEDTCLYIRSVLLEHHVLRRLDDFRTERPSCIA